MSLVSDMEETDFKLRYLKVHLSQFPATAESKGIFKRKTIAIQSNSGKIMIRNY